MSYRYAYLIPDEESRHIDTETDAVSSRTVWVEDDAPVRTGLLGPTSDPIYRVRERIQFGFVKS